MKPLVSICIPTHNRSHYIAQTIKSVLTQTYTKYELIIWNDGSTDKTKDIVKGFKDKRITYYENANNIGYVKTMNKCTKTAKGEYIMHLSDDDLMLPTMLEEMINALKDTDGRQIGFVVPQTINIDEKGKVISIPRLQIDSNNWVLLQPQEFIFNFTLHGRKIRDRYRFNTSFPSTLFNRKILIEMGMSDENVSVSHDVLIESKICLLYPVLVIDKPLFKYRVHANWGSSLNRNGKFLNEYTSFLNLLFQFVDEKRIYFPYDFKKYCIDALLSYLFSINGGLVRLAARYSGNYHERIQILNEYIRFGIRKKASLLYKPSFYAAVLLSLFPQRILLIAGRKAGQI